MLDELRSNITGANSNAFLVRSINEEGLETERIAALLLLRRGISVARGDQSEEEVSKNLEVTKKLPKLTVRLPPPHWLSSRGRIFSPVPFASTSRQCVEDRNRREKNRADHCSRLSPSLLSLPPSLPIFTQAVSAVFLLRTTSC